MTSARCCALRMVVSSVEELMCCGGAGQHTTALALHSRGSSSGALQVPG